MSQWFNKDFFCNLFRSLGFKNTRPTYTAQVTFPQLTLSHLKKELSVDCLVLDVNQTLIPYKSSSVPREVKEKLDEFRQFYRICALSNFASQETRGNVSRAVEKALTDLDIHIVKTRKKKPASDGFLEALDHFQTEPSQCAVIGDRIFTDIVGANMIGMRSVLVEPLDESKDPVSIAFYRWIERAVYHFWHH